MGYSDTVTIRRTVGVKKDEYSIDRKSATRNDVKSLLESGGFSQSNPYYIVPQGRVTALTNAKDSERLELLKEVAGTKVYDDRRAESIKVLNESEIKHKTIEESLQFIRERLEELEKEKEELKEYQIIDRQKRSLDYTLLDRELQEINETLESLKEERENGIALNNQRLEQFNSLEEHVNEIESTLSKLKNDTRLLGVERARLKQELKLKIKDKARREVECDQLERSAASSREAIAQKRQEISNLTQLITDKKAEFDSIQPQLLELKAREQELRQEVQNLESAKNILLSKQGRNYRFNSQQERDQWLQNELAGLSSNIAELESVNSSSKKSLADLEQQLAAVRSSIDEIKAQGNSKAQLLKQQQELLDEAESEYLALDNERKSLWSEEQRANSVLENLQDDIKQSQRAAFSTLSRAQSSGLKAVKRISNKLGLNGVYGTIAELIDVAPEFKLATEITAGNSLLHVVVDDEETASKIMAELLREKSGRVTFMPLNRLSPRTPNYPTSDDVTPLINHLQYDQIFDPAVRQIFGNTIVVRNLEMGSQIAHNNDLNAITLEGDRVNTKGVMTGGFYDIRKSRLTAFQKLKEMNDLFSVKEEEYRTIQKRIRELDERINQSRSNKYKIESEIQTLRNSLSPLNNLRQSKTIEESQIKEMIQEVQQSIQDSEINIQNYTNQKNSYLAELQSPFDQVLSDEEIQQLREINQQLPRKVKQLNDLSMERLNIEQRSTQLDVEIHQDLEFRVEQLTSSLENNALDEDDEMPQDLGGRDPGHALTLARQQLQNLVENIASIEEKLESLEADIERSNAEIAETEKQLSIATETRFKIGRSIESLHKQMEKSIAKNTLLTERHDEVQRKIRELGVLPPNAFTEFEGTPSEQIVNKLRKISDKLKKFSHVNKKAVEQYNNFTKQEEKLEDRKRELETSHESIEQLIHTLDMRKDEAIDRTFKQVSKAFTEIFEKLVPGGKGELIMRRKHDAVNGNNRGNDYESGSDDEEEAQEQQTRRRGNRNPRNTIVSVDSYVGVGISVSFNSKEDDQQRIEQLSGGQKSLCALTLIFAIQQSDPAPFYLFDEIDANLDTQYRTSVAAMIHELARSAQFICTTFRPEMLQVADKFYGVSFENRMSTISTIDKEHALTFIEGYQAR